MRFKVLFLSWLLSASLPLLATGPEAWDRFGGVTALLPVHSLCQDDDGTVWFGTDCSLYGFDGYDLRAFPYEKGDVLVNAVCPFGGQIFLGTNSGLYRFDGKTERVEWEEDFRGRVVRVLLAGDKALWIGTEDGLYLWLTEEDHARRVAGGRDVFSLSLSEDGVYVGTRNDLLSYSLATGTLASLLAETEHLSNRFSIVTAILPRGPESLWIGTSRALFSFDLFSGQAAEMASFPIVKDLCRDGNTLLVGTDGGLFRYFPDSGSVEQETTDVVWSLMSDRQQGVWMGTDNGFGRRKAPSVFCPLEGLPDEDGILYEHMLKDGKGRIWLGGNRGIVMLEEGRTRHFRVGNPTYPLAHNKVNVITEDPRTGTVYVGTDVGYLVFNEATGRFDHFRIEGTNNWIYDILVDGDTLWFGTYDGLFRMEGGRVVQTCSEADGLLNEDVSRVVKYPSGGLALLTRDQRVWILDTLSGRPAPYDLSGLLEQPLVDHVLTDEAGTLWLCCRNRLVQAGAEPVVKADLEMEDPGSVRSMTDIGGHILFCTMEGVFTVSKETGEILCVSADRRYAGAGYDSRQREILFGGLETVDRLSVSDLYAEMDRPSLPVRFTGMTVNGQRRISREELASGRLVLSFRENNLILHFSDHNYDPETRRRFLFRLQGRHSGWTRRLSENSISLSGLSPGSYQVSIGPGRGDVSDCLRLRIRRPFFQSWGMVSVYIVFLILLIAWIISFFTMRKEYKMAQEKRDILLEQSRQKSDFFMHIAHELKTPLSLVLAPLTKAEGDCPPGSLHDLLALARENAMKISSLVHVSMDIFNNRKEIAGSLILTDVEFVEFARNILDAFRRSYPDLDFVFTSPHERMFVHVDIIKMETCLNNLISNACKYTPEGGSVILSLDWGGTGDLVVKVSDTGIGIPKKEIPFVFQRFFQSSLTQGKGYDSTGVGLSLLKEYVELHGGNVSADSDENGTTFVMVVPSRRDVLDSPDPLSGPAMDKEGKPLIAIVEDNHQVCSFLEKVLGGKYRCVSVHNGKSGLKLCRDILPDLIISDVLMPVMDGMEMCRQIRADASLATVPIILLTAKGDPHTENESNNLGIDAFIPKPFDLAVLLSRVEQLLDSRKRLKQAVRLDMIAAPDPTMDLSYDERILKKVTKLIEEHLDENNLSVAELCRLGGFNEKQLYRKLKQLTGMSTVEYIRSIRLKKAALMLQNGGFTVSEVMYAVGFSNISYFSRAFSAAFGQAPSEYRKRYETASKTS